MKNLIIISILLHLGFGVYGQNFNITKSHSSNFIQIDSIEKYTFHIDNREYTVNITPEASEIRNLVNKVDTLTKEKKELTKFLYYNLDSYIYCKKLIAIKLTSLKNEKQNFKNKIKGSNKAIELKEYYSKIEKIEEKIDSLKTKRSEFNSNPKKVNDFLVLEIEQNKKALENIQKKTENTDSASEINELYVTKKTIRDKIKAIEKVKGESYEKLTIRSNKTPYSEEVNLRIKEIKDSIPLLNFKIKKWYKKYSTDLLKEKNSHFFLYNSKKEKYRVLSLFNTIYGNENTINTINSTGFNLSSNSGSLYSELLSIKTGKFRVSIGGLITASNDEENGEDTKESNDKNNDEAIQKLISGGGNTILKIESPVFYHHSKNNYFTNISLWNIKGTADFPQFGTKSSDFSGTFSIGFQSHFNLLLRDDVDKNKELRFFADLNINAFVGSDKYITDLLGNTNENKVLFGKLTLGVRLLKNIQLSVVVYQFGSHENLRNNKIVIGSTILP